MAQRNRELSQLGSFLEINNSNKNISITTTETPYVGIGTINPTSKLHVIGNTNISGIISATGYYLNGNPLVSVEFQTWQTIGSDIHRSTGNVGVGTTNPFSKFTVIGDITASNIGIGTTSPREKLSVYDISSTKTHSNLTYRTDANIPTGIGIGIEYYPSYTTPGTQTSYAIANYSTITGNVIAGSTNNGYIRSGVDVALRGRRSTDNGTLAEITGRRIAFGHWNDAPIFVSPITTNAYGLIVDGFGYTGNITNIYGISISRIGNVVNQSSVKNAYGIYSDINAVDGTDNAYNLYIAGSANNYISGNLGIGLSTPVSSLDTNGPIISRNGAFIFQSINVIGNWVDPTSITALNVDHIWNYDGDLYGLPGAYHFVNNARYKTSGNSALRAGGFYNMDDTGTASQRLQISGGAYISGNLGIGTATPGEKLQVDGNLRIGISNVSNYIAFRGTTGDNELTYTHTYIGERIYETGSQKSELLLFKGNDPTSLFGPDRIRLAAAEFRFDTLGISTNGTFEQVGVSTNITNKMVLTNAGNLGIGITNPTSKLQVSGDVYVTGIITSTSMDIGNELRISNQPIRSIISTYGIVFGL